MILFQKNDNLKLRRIFIKLYNEICYPLLYHSLLPGLNLHSNEDLEVRTSIINYQKLNSIFDFSTKKLKSISIRLGHRSLIAAQSS